MLEIMRCNLCGKLAMIIRDGGRRTICCDQLMEKLVEQGNGAQGEGHVPLIEKKGTGIRVKVPGVPSPMGKDHYIEWIEVTEGKKLQVMGLSPGDAPEAEFAGAGPGAKSRVYCEEHGLWSNRPSKPKG
jgi:superoxide reductase